MTSVIHSPEQWDAQYESGHWEYLSEPRVAGHYRLMAGAFLEHAEFGDVLDVGCGPGILLDHLQRFRTYTGIDASTEAVERAQRRHPYGASHVFHVSEADGFPGLGQRWGAVVFSEVLYCLADPIATLARYESMLADHGVFIVSISTTQPECWRLVIEAYTGRVVEMWEIRNALSGNGWNVAVIRP